MIEEVWEPYGDEAKDTRTMILDKEKRIIVDSIKGNLIPHVSSLKMPKELYDYLTNMLKGKNINYNMIFTQKYRHHHVMRYVFPCFFQSLRVSLEKW